MCPRALYFSSVAIAVRLVQVSAKFERWGHVGVMWVFVCMCVKDLSKKTSLQPGVLVYTPLPLSASVPSHLYGLICVRTATCLSIRISAAFLHAGMPPT